MCPLKRPPSEWLQEAVDSGSIPIGMVTKGQTWEHSLTTLISEWARWISFKSPFSFQSSFFGEWVEEDLADKALNGLDPSCHRFLHADVYNSTRTLSRLCDSAIPCTASLKNEMQFKMYTPACTLSCRHYVELYRSTSPRGRLQNCALCAH